MILRVFLIVLIFYVFFPWLTHGTISGYDFIYLYPETLSYFSLLPAVYKDYSLLGQNAFLFSGIETYYQASGAFLSRFMSWEIIARIVWIFPILICSILSSYYLTRSIIGVFIYVTNTYFLMIVAGGQMGISLAFAIFPFVIKMCIDIAQTSIKDKKILPKLQKNILKKVLAGVVLGLLLFFDLRVGYIAIFVIFSYFLYELLSVKKISLQNFKYVTFVFGLVVLSAIIVNLSWILPVIFYGTGVEQFSGVYTKNSALDFFSFAKLENTISLLHPNWPENIFGKVAFMKGEFLLLPILAFISLLFIKKEKDRKIIFFAFIGLLGAFLAKGSNPPYGEIYHFLFSYFPGFIMFRDPTKFYILIALAFSVLIPFTISNVQNAVRYKFGNWTTYAFQIVLGLFFLFLLLPVFQGRLEGVFKPYALPSEYKALSEFISSQDEFFRTLWVPNLPRTVVTSALHPAVVPLNVVGEIDTDKILQSLQKTTNQRLLDSASIKYVILPYDFHHEIFIDDHKYSEREYQKVHKTLSAMSWLKEERRFGKLIVYKTSTYRPLFSVNNKQIYSTRKTATHYHVFLTNVKKGDYLHFSQAYDPKWKLRIEGTDVEMEKDGLTNRIKLPRSGNYTADVVYEPQRLANIGFTITLFFVLTVTGFGLFSYLRRKK